MKKDIKTLVSFFKIFQFQWIPYGITTAMVACRNFFITFLTAAITSSVVALLVGEAEFHLAQEALFFMILILLFVVFDTVGIYGQTVSIHKMMNRLKSKIYQRILHSRVFEIEKIGKRGEIISRINTDVDLSFSLLSYGVLLPFMYLISGIGATIIIGNIHVFLCIGIYVLALLALMTQVIVSRRIRKVQGEIREHTTECLSFYLDTVSGSHNVKLSNLSTYVMKNFQGKMDRFLLLYRGKGRLDSVERGVSSTIHFISFFGVLFAGLGLYANRAMLISDLVMVIQMQSLIITMVVSFSSSFSIIQSSLSGVERVKEVLDLEDENQKGKSMFKPGLSLVTAEHLRVTYPNGTVAFQDLNLTIPANQVVGLVGPSGSGKSTLLKALLKFYPYQAGSLKIYENEIHKCDLTSLRMHIAYVSQENIIFEGTIKENILKGTKRREITDAEIVEVLEEMGALQWVVETEKGINTVLTEGGVNLSGGQRQMLAIARAILQMRPLMFLDEAFVGVDEGRVKQIMAYLKTLEYTPCILIVTHDSTVIDACDCVVEF